MTFGHRSLLLAAFGLSITALVPACGDDTTADGGAHASTSSKSGSGSTSASTGVGGAGQPLVVLEWNTHNFFDDKNNSSAPEETVVSAAEYQQHVTAVSKIIGEFDPDIAILSEIENEEVLAALDDALGGKYPEHQLIEGNDPRGVNIAALSKTSFSSVVSHAGETFTQNGLPAPSYQFARDAVEYHLTKNGRNVVFIGVHFRSKGPPDDANKRLAEAQHARSIADGIAAADPTAAIGILGDFNDLPDSDPWKAIAGNDGAYTDAPSYVTDADRWTFDFQNSHELIDHVMMNATMNTLVDKAAQKIRHGSDVDAASDHAPIITTLQVK